MIAELVQRLRRRRHPRVQLESSFELEVPGWNGTEGKALDVSPGGIAVRLADSVDIGDSVIFSVVVPEQPAFEITAEVRHVRETPQGDYFVGLRWSANEVEGHQAFRAMTGGPGDSDLDAA